MPQLLPLFLLKELIKTLLLGPGPCQDSCSSRGELPPTVKGKVQEDRITHKTPLVIMVKGNSIMENYRR
jgi:hypothetical protein